jgi:hypothetical protein
MTSIEWLISELKLNDTIEKENLIIAKQIIEQAKKMHKQEVMNGFNQGHREGWIDGMGLSMDDQDVETFQDANLYYQQTFVSKGSDEAIKCTCNVDSFLCQIHGTSDGKTITAF